MKLMFLYTTVPTSIFDPCLVIDGKQMRFLGNLDFKNDFKKSHFKFLGRWIHSSLNEQVIKEVVRSKFLEDMKTVSESRVRGFKKLWLYQFYVLARFSWPFMIHDFDLCMQRHRPSCNSDAKEVVWCGSLC